MEYKVVLLILFFFWKQRKHLRDIQSSTHLYGRSYFSTMDRALMEQHQGQLPLAFTTGKEKYLLLITWNGLGEVDVCVEKWRCVFEQTCTECSDETLSISEETEWQARPRLEDNRLYQGWWSGGGQRGGVWGRQDCRQHAVAHSSANEGGKGVSF